jgi:hypothetical protein
MMMPNERGSPTHRHYTFSLSKTALHQHRPQQPSPPIRPLTSFPSALKPAPPALQKDNTSDDCCCDIPMQSLRSVSSSLLARSFATAAPKFDASKLNSFIKGSDAK